MKATLITTFFVAAAILVLHADHTKDDYAMMTNDLQGLIEHELENFVRVGKNRSYLVFEDSRTGRFIQFSKDEDKLVFDLPLKPLTSIERDRAIKLLGLYGYPVQSAKLLDSPDGAAVDNWQGWNFHLPGSSRQGSEIAARVFVEVFQTADPELTLEYGE